MGVTMSKLPRDGRPMKMDPFLAEAIERELAPYTGKRLRRAQKAVLQVSRSGFTGTFHTLVKEYGARIKESVA